MKKIAICVFAMLFASAVRVAAQVDPHFSQFYAYPLWLNPAMAGMSDGDCRVTGIYRRQWSSITTPFTTEGVSADFITNRNINLGVNLMNQMAGDAGYKYVNAYGTIAYSGIKWGPDNTRQVTIGIQAGLLSRRIDPSKFRFGDQWNAVTGYDPSNPTADFVSKTSAAVFDVGAGIAYQDANPESKVNFYGGFSAFHLTQPEDPFISNAAKGFLPVRYTMHAGVRVRATDVLSIVPNVLYMRQGNAQEKMIGIFGDLEVNETMELLFGGSYRVQDAVSPYVGFSYRNIVLGMNYDVTTSALGKTVKGTNAMELSLTWTSRKTGKSMRYLSCPRF